MEKKRQRIVLVRKRKEKDFIVRHKFEFVEVVEKLTTEISEKKKKTTDIVLFCKGI